MAQHVSPLNTQVKRALALFGAHSPTLTVDRYHNYIQYLTAWTPIRPRSSDLSKRPAPLATLSDNTTVQGQWISIENMTSISRKYSTADYNRTVVNVTMAMPHAGILNATRDPRNGIVQPQDLNVGYDSWET